MPRQRSRDLDPVPGFLWALAPLALALFIFPPMFNTSRAAAFIWVIVLGVLAFLGYRFIFPPEPPEPADLQQKKRTAIFRLNTLTVNDSAPSPLLNPFKKKAAIPTASTSAPDLPVQLEKIDWFQFEKIVSLLYKKLGFKVTRRGGANPDGGIDLIIEKDGLVTAVQCKQWKAWRVGVKTIREFLGALTDADLNRGIFITMKGYTGEAKQLAAKHSIEILTGGNLVKLLRSTDIEHDPEALELLGSTRKYCPKCERPMVLRTARKGLNAGEQFWGCTAYPHCRFMLPYEKSAVQDDSRYVPKG